DRTIESNSRIENLEEFLTVTKEFEKTAEEDKSLIAFLTDLALIADIDSMDNESNQESTEKVTLMTLHSAKGLVSTVAFIIGREENVLPHCRSMVDNDEMEQERPLAYVGITRAEEQLYLTHAQMRTLYGRTNSNQKSRFIKESPVDLLEVVEEESAS